MRPDASVVGSVHTLLPFFLLGVVLGVCFDVFRVLDRERILRIVFHIQNTAERKLRAVFQSEHLPALRVLLLFHYGTPA